MKNVDVLVLGAGMIGVSCAYHAIKRGFSVVMVDRRGAGEETSYGNAGVIDSDSFYPTTMPTDFLSVAKIAFNKQFSSHYQPSGLINNARWLYDYWRYSHDEKKLEIALNIREMFSVVADEHKQMAESAGVSSLLKETGWLKVYRNEATLIAARIEAELAKAHGIDNPELTPAEIYELEPHLKQVLVGGHWAKGALTCANPGRLTKAYAAMFVNEGGVFLNGEATTLLKKNEGWYVMTSEGAVIAKHVVIALGAWSMDVLEPFGYRFPLTSKRGYHKHYKPKGNAFLGRQVCDVDYGYVLAPMEQGVRLTTGVEIANRDAPKTPVQLARTLPKAQELFDLGEEVESEAWLGRRPAFPDAYPIIDKAPNHENMIFAFGHGHWGFTQGPATGRAVADLLKGDKPFINLKPYSALRFNDEW